jgi:hypothetical protein
MRVDTPQLHAAQPRRSKSGLCRILSAAPACGWLLAGCLASTHDDASEATAAHQAATQCVDSGSDGSLDVPSHPGAVHCSSDDDCDGVAANCERSAGLCLMRCPNVMLATQADLRAAQACREIDGDLTVRSMELERIELPYLEHVSGSILAVGGSPLVEFALPALREVGTPGSLDIVELGFTTSVLQRVSMPELHTVHGDFSIVAAEGITELHLPELRTVDGAFGLIGLPRLTTLELNEDLKPGRLAAFQSLCSLPFTALNSPSALTTEQLSLQDLGCCTASSFACESTLCQCGS